MEHPGFFQKAGPITLGDLCDKLELTCPEGEEGREVTGLGSLAAATKDEISFFEDRKLIKTFKASSAGICLTPSEFEASAPDGMITLITEKPHAAFVTALKLFYPDSNWSKTTLSTGPLIDETAIIEDDVTIEPGAIIGREARIGTGSRISAGAVIGYRCYIGRNCMIGPNTVITHTLIGNDVTIHPGCAIGQDGFGYLMGKGGHQKVPQIGRVIIQDMVEIGANTAIDRGALADTIIGEGTKIDNLVQIGHNVVIGCHAVIVSLTGLSGSTKIGNYVVMGGQTGTVGHIEIGDGAQIAASSKVHKSVPAGKRYGGTPAKPMKQWFKEIIALERLAEGREKK